MGLNFTITTTSSDDRGFYEFADLPEGTFTVWAFVQGYGAEGKQVALNPLTPIDDLDFTLEPPACPIVFALGKDAKEDELNTLRGFRDEVLSETPEGQEMIKLYYEWGPLVIQAMDEEEKFKKKVREVIDAFLPLIRKILE